MPTTAGSRTVAEDRISVCEGRLSVARRIGVLSRTAARTTRQARNRCVTTNSIPSAEEIKRPSGVNSTPPLDGTVADPAVIAAAVKGWAIWAMLNGALTADTGVVAESLSRAIEGPGSEAPAISR